MEYPKIETLFDRDSRFRVMLGHLRMPEFALPSQWLITEKIDGTNVRIILDRTGSVSYHGRTLQVQLHSHLLDILRSSLPSERVRSAFDPETDAIIFGEGYGQKIQSGGLYRNDPSIRIFDVVVFGQSGKVWWLNWENVEDVARKLGVLTVPVIARSCSLGDAITLVWGHSLVAAEDSRQKSDREGIVARTDPLLFTRAGARLMWKLKIRDFPRERGSNHGTKKGDEDRRVENDTPHDPDRG